ncbi:MAG: hypothetical protein C4342_06000 [Armatimonadota bacterium]
MRFILIRNLEFLKMVFTGSAIQSFLIYLIDFDRKEGDVVHEYNGFFSTTTFHLFFLVSICFRGL